jgi:hypothetical protein
VTIPNSVETIGGMAFTNCTSLTKVTIGSSVTVIEDAALGDCTALTEITCLNPAPPAISYYTFYNVPSSCTLRVPAGSVAAYRAAAHWGTFGTIAVIGGDVPDVYFEQHKSFRNDYETMVYFTTTSKNPQDLRVEVVTQTVPDGWAVEVEQFTCNSDGYNGYFKVTSPANPIPAENEALVVAYDVATGRSTVRAIKLSPH